MGDQTAIQEALKSALNFEHTGHDYYTGVAQKSVNPLTKEVFTALAGQELVHMERIQEIFSNLNFDGVKPGTHGYGMEKLIRGIFGRFSTQERQAWDMDNAEAYEYAEELERKSIALYDKLAGDAENPVEKQFFQELSAEEHQHLNALENVYNYLQRTGDWFASDESHVWNWMNT